MAIAAVQQSQVDLSAPQPLAVVAVMAVLALMAPQLALAAMAALVTTSLPGGVAHRCSWLLVAAAPAAAAPDLAAVDLVAMLVQLAVPTDLVLLHKRDLAAAVPWLVPPPVTRVVAAPTAK